MRIDAQSRSKQRETGTKNFCKQEKAKENSSTIRLMSHQIFIQTKGTLRILIKTKQKYLDNSGNKLKRNKISERKIRRNF